MAKRPTTLNLDDETFDQLTDLSEYFRISKSSLLRLMIQARYDEHFRGVKPQEELV